VNTNLPEIDVAVSGSQLHNFGEHIENRSFARKLISLDGTHCGPDHLNTLAIVEMPVNLQLRFIAQ
jgi:hypothetical protein